MREARAFTKTVLSPAQATPGSDGRPAGTCGRYEKLCVAPPVENKR